MRAIFSLFLIFCLSIPLLAEAATYYVDFTNGADSNIGTDTGHPWKRVRGMTGVTSTAAAATFNDGDSIMFKGGETWTSSYPWTLRHGTSATVTYTTDHNWYTGAAWSQPIFDREGGNPGGTGMINLSTAGWVTLNDLYFKGCGVLNQSDIVNKCLVFTNAHDITITNSTFRTYSWISVYIPENVAGSYSNFTFTGNDVANTSSFLWMASSATNIQIHNLTINNNVFHDMASQLGGLPDATYPAAVNPHGNPILHYFSSGGHNDTTQYLDGVVICNNRTYGDFRNTKDATGVANTAMIFTEGSASGYLCNNDFSFTPVAANMFNSLVLLAGYHNAHASTVEVYNNTFAQSGLNAMSRALGTQDLVATLTVKNNLFSGMQYPIDYATTVEFVSLTSDYNLLKSTTGQLKYNGTVQSYATWQAAGRDTHSILGTDPLLVSIPDNLHIQPGSPAIGTGVDLSGLGYDILNTDRDGISRGGAWDIGAYMQQGGVGAPSAPGSLRALSESGNSFTLIWNPSTADNLAGYRIYRGTTTGQTTTLIKEITATTAATTSTPMTQLSQVIGKAGTYYYTVTAYNTNNQESVKSTEVSKVITGFTRTVRP